MLLHIRGLHVTITYNVVHVREHITGYVQLHTTCHVRLGLHILLRWRQTAAVLSPSLLDLCVQDDPVITLLVIQYNQLPMQHKNVT